MTVVDEIAALTGSIGEHAVDAVGKKHLAALAVVVSAADMSARISLTLQQNTEKEQRRALEKLFDVQELFFDDVSMEFAFGVDDLRAADVATSSQYSYA